LIIKNENVDNTRKEQPSENIFTIYVSTSFVLVVSSGLLKNILFGFYCIQMQIAETGGVV